MNVTSLNPPASPGLYEISSVCHPLARAYRVYISYRSPANRAASSPPVPARISTIRLPKSSLGSTRSWSSIRALRASYCGRRAANSSSTIARRSGSFSPSAIASVCRIWSATCWNSRYGLTSLARLPCSLATWVNRVWSPATAGSASCSSSSRNLASFCSITGHMGHPRVGERGQGRKKAEGGRRKAAGFAPSAFRLRRAGLLLLAVGLGGDLLPVGRVLVLLLELLDPPGGVDELHLPGEERVAGGRDFELVERVLVPVGPLDLVVRLDGG